LAKILIVGAASGIGSSVAASLLQNTPHSIVTVDDLRVEPNLNNMQFAMSHKRGDRHRFHLTSVNDSHISSKLFEIERPDYVIFCKTPESLAYHQSLVKIIQCASRTKTKVLYINQDSWSCSRNESYKYGVEICRSDSNKDVVCILNTCRIYGPRQEIGDPIVSIMSKIIDHEPSRVESSSDRPKEWIYIKDLLSAIERIIQSESVCGEYSAASNQVASEHEIIMCLKMISEGRDFDFNQNCDYVPQDCRRLRSVGWEPKYALREALEHTLAWYSVNRWAAA